MGLGALSAVWGLWQRPQLPTGPSPPVHTGASSSHAVLTGLLDSALLRAAGGEAQRAVGGPHRGLPPFPKPGRALEGAAPQEAQAPGRGHHTSAQGCQPRACFALLSTETPKLPLPVSSPGRTRLRDVTALPPTQEQPVCLSRVHRLAAHSFPTHRAVFRTRGHRRPYNHTAPPNADGCLRGFLAQSCLSHHRCQDYRADPELQGVTLWEQAPPAGSSREGRKGRWVERGDRKRGDRKEGRYYRSLARPPTAFLPSSFLKPDEKKVV